MYSILDDLKERAIRDFAVPPTASEPKSPQETELRAKIWLRDAHIEALKYELASKRAQHSVGSPELVAAAEHNAQRAYENGIQVGTRRLHRSLKRAATQLAAAAHAMKNALDGSGPDAA